MIVKLTPLLSLGIAFLFFLFFAAYAVERGCFNRKRNVNGLVRNWFLVERLNDR